MIASTEPHNAAAAGELRVAEISRRNASADDPLIRTLTAAAGQFIVRRGDESTVIAVIPLVQ